MSRTRNERLSILLPYVFFFAVILVGFGVRYSYLERWEQSPERFTVQGRPLILTIDGYFYLRLADQVRNSAYQSFDANRAVPQGMEQGAYAPLLSSLTAWAAPFVGNSLDWAALLLPSLLGVLLAFPVFFWARSLTGESGHGAWFGAVAALVALLAPFYTQRSTIGWYDTDLLNVTLATMCAYFFMRFGLAKDRALIWKRYVFLVCGLFTLLIFLWWWDQVVEITAGVALLPLAVALVLHYRPSKREGLLFYGGLIAVVLVGGACVGGELIHAKFSNLIGTFGYVLEKGKDVFPAASHYVTEQSRTTFTQVAKASMGGLPAFILAATGVLLMLIRKPWQSIYLVSVLCIAAMSFIAARFQIYLAPLCGLGVAVLCHEAWRQREKLPMMLLVAPVVLAALLFSQYTDILQDKRDIIPGGHPDLYAAMMQLPEKTPDDAVVWTSWDNAYPLMYYANRGTIIDGQTHTGQRLWVSYLPMAVSSPRLAANWMRFYCTRGLPGLEKVNTLFGNNWQKSTDFLKQALAHGPETTRTLLNSLQSRGGQSVDTWLAYLFPEKSRPIYWFLDHHTFHYNWYKLGNWRFDTQKGPAFTNLMIWDLKEKIGEKSEPGQFHGFMYALNQAARIDAKRGVVIIGNQQIPLALRIDITGTKRKVTRYNSVLNSYVLAVDHVHKYAVVSSKNVTESVFYKQFILNKAPIEYFRLVQNTPASSQVWEVLGDTYAPQN